MARRGIRFAMLFALATSAAAVAQSAPAIPAGSATPATDSASSLEGAPIVNRNPQVTGTVISSDANRLTVRDDKGAQMVFIVNETTPEPRIFSVGVRVTADYVTLAGTGTVVRKVVVAPKLMTPDFETTVTRTTATGATGATTAPAANPVPAPAPSTDASTSSATLPATASPLPAVALFGLFAAAGAISVRKARQS
ncbi:MAG: hypothetical protein ABI639_02055 [Thermoanaerobaculia bacterium]